MKLSIFVVFTLISMCSIAQVERNTTTKKLKNVSVNKSSETKTISKSTHSSNDANKVYTSEELNKKIHAFQIKIDHINSDPTRKQQATADGSLKKLEDRKKEYELQLEKLTTEKQ
jgi:hypothetical protein